MSAIVVGGGPAGCAAARRLSGLGHEVMLLEAANRLGGRSWTLRDHGYAIDAGAFVIGTGFTRAMDLIDSCRRLDEVRTFEATIGFVEGSRCCLVRPNSLRNFLTLPIIGWPTKLRLASGTVALPQDLFDERATATADNGESATAWARRRFGDEGYELIIRPMVQFLGIPAEDLSAAFAARLLRTNWRIRMLALRDGIGSFAERLVEAVDVHLAAPAERIESARGGVRVWAAGGAAHDADGAVVATDAVEAGQLLASPAATAALGRVEYLSAIHVSLGFECDPWPDLTPHWFMPVGRGEHPIAITGLLSRRSPGAVPPGAQVVDLYFSRAASARFGDREALEQALRSLPDLLGGPAPKPSFEHVFRFPRALPVLAPGAVARLSAIREAVGGRVALAGDYMAYPSIETAVRSGEAAADRLHAACGGGEARQPAASAAATA